MISLFEREKREFRSAADGAATARVAANIPIIISGKDGTGRFREYCQTLVISRTAAKIETMHDLRIGTELAIEDQYLQRVSKGRVVWVGKQTENGKGRQVGICLTDSQDFWGLEFPAETDGRDALKDEAEEGSGRNAGTESAAAPEAQPTAEPQPSPNPEESVTPVELRAPALDFDPVPRTLQRVAQLRAEPAVATDDENGVPSAASSEGHPEPDPVDAIDPTLHATVEDSATKMEECIETSSRHFEEKMAEAAESVVIRTAVNLRSLAVGLEEKARSEFAEKMGAIEMRSRLCEENLVKAADEVVARAEASLQGVASSLGEKTRNELAEKVGSIEARVQETVAQIEAVLPKLQDISNYGAEIEKARQSLKQLSSGAVEFALEELSELIEREIRPVASSLGVRAREYVQQEGTAALEALLQGEAGDRLQKWFEDAQQAQVPFVEAKIQESAESHQQASIEKLKAQLESLVAESAEKARQKSEEAVAQSVEAMNRRLEQVETSLHEKVDQATSHLNELLARVAASAEAVSAILQKQADEICNRLLGATEAIEKQRLEAAESAISGMTRKLTESSVAHFRVLAEDKTREFVDVMEQTQERLVIETAAALRAKIGRMLMALQTSCEDPIAAADADDSTVAV